MPLGCCCDSNQDRHREQHSFTARKQPIPISTMDAIPSISAELGGLSLKLKQVGVFRTATSGPGASQRLHKACSRRAWVRDRVIAQPSYARREMPKYNQSAVGRTLLCSSATIYQSALDQQLMTPAAMQFRHPAHRINREVLNLCFAVTFSAACNALSSARQR